MRIDESLISFFIDGAAMGGDPLLGECFNGVQIQTHALSKRSVQSVEHESCQAA
ncbi:hypothetical protein [Pseudomonas sp. RGM 3321]|uniref:hypothetical protein n=1 Tax=Pseudomonas sp. RGM 3321 TaxID=2930089 RepID=UPI001FCC2925|nr:hypothetical protein [Pseudomonas sp. RGM 3321]MCJ2372988.1 hypothetical protein [Pseudomonas sp. RGM 3321]